MSSLGLPKSLWLLGSIYRRHPPGTRPPALQLGGDWRITGVLADELKARPQLVTTAYYREWSMAGRLIAWHRAKVERPVDRPLYTAKELQTARD